MKNKEKDAEGSARILSEDYGLIRQHGIIDPMGPTAQRWNKIFLGACLFSLYIDPLFFLVPEVKPEFCIAEGLQVQANLTIIRSVADLFYFLNIIVQFRTAYLEPSSRVFGRGELVADPWKIALRYLRFSFWVDLAAVLPFPQVYFWQVLPKIKDILISDRKTALRLVTLAQFLLRLVLAYPLFIQIAKSTDIISKRAWFGSAYNLLFYILASQVTGCCWYLLAVQRQLACWRSLCIPANTSCEYEFFDCGTIHIKHRDAWIRSSNISKICQPSENYYNFGIYSDMINGANVTSATFLQKMFYLLWWGFWNVCTLGQNLTTSINIGENWFAMMFVTLGLINIGLLFANLQVVRIISRNLHYNVLNITLQPMEYYVLNKLKKIMLILKKNYIESATVRLDEYMLQRNDTEKWMHHRQLHPDLRECIRKYEQHKWVATRGIDEEGLLKGLPPDLRRQIKRHLCLDLLRRVPLFNQMDDRLLDAICERLEPTLSPQGTLLISEGDPLTEMLFISRGHLHSYTTGGGRFFNSSEVGPGDFSGEELLTWALEPPQPDSPRPISTCTLTAVTDIEALALKAEDLRFAAAQFRRLHSREVRHTLRSYSRQWRTWAACYIQAAWRRHCMRKVLGELEAKEECEQPHETTLYEEMGVFVPRPGSGMATYAARVMADIRRGSSNRFGPDSYVLRSLN